jgi:hypothetical protein
MKFVIKINIFVLILIKFSFQDDSKPPEVNVNYIPKKQWRMSKHDLADIKLDIEREVMINI